MLALSTIVDPAETCTRWQHFWHGELYGRPPVVASITKPNYAQVWPGERRYERALHGQYELILDAIDRWLDATLFLADTVPFFEPGLGPDQFAAFFGGTLHISEDSPETSWMEPFVRNTWKDVLPLRVREDNPVWRGLLNFYQRVAAHARNRYVVGMADLHSNLDALAAMRGPERLCIDLYDCPDLVAAALADMRAAYPFVYETLSAAGGMNSAGGTIGWLPLWCPGRCATIQCDTLCLISPEFSRRFVLPALEEEAAFLDHSILHLDGPGALVHLDDLLAISRIDVVQWVPGAGQPPMHTWIELLRHIQRSGKAVYVYGVRVDDVKQIHPMLRPEKTVYSVELDSCEEGEALLAWLTRHC
ncbi:MAG: hypothetical protein N2595_07025 [bacterium]|nr:hypothetical protein [bacterium]